MIEYRRILNRSVIIPLLVAVLSIPTFLYFYLPQKKALDQQRNTFVSVKKGLREVAGDGATLVSLEQSVLRTKTNIEQVTRRFPSSKEQAIAELSKAANKFGVSFESVRSNERTVDRTAEPAIFAAKMALSKVALEINARGDYVSLGRFFEHIRGPGQQLYVVENISLVRSRNSEDLAARIRLFFYLAGRNG